MNSHHDIVNNYLISYGVAIFNAISIKVGLKGEKDDGDVFCTVSKEQYNGICIGDDCLLFTWRMIIRRIKKEFHLK